MSAKWIPLRSIAPEGTEFILTDQSIWLAPIREFGLDCRISRPLEARLFILPQQDGLFLRGRVSGGLILPCSLCAEDAHVSLEQLFDDFEPFPPAEEKPARGARPGSGGRGTRAAPPEDKLADLDIDAYFIRWSPQGLGLEINPDSLVWEEFAQALPQRPLCREKCAGLCPVCGRNLNLAACACAAEELDPRLEKLRNFKPAR